MEFSAETWRLGFSAEALVLNARTNRIDMLKTRNLYNFSRYFQNIRFKQKYLSYDSYLEFRITCNIVKNKQTRLV